MDYGIVFLDQLSKKENRKKSIFFPNSLLDFRYRVVPPVPEMCPKMTFYRLLNKKIQKIIYRSKQIYNEKKYFFRRKKISVPFKNKLFYREFIWEYDPAVSWALSGRHMQFSVAMGFSNTGF